jgi:hypothetical protein
MARTLFFNDIIRLRIHSRQTLFPSSPSFSLSLFLISLSPSSLSFSLCEEMNATQGRSCQLILCLGRGLQLRVVEQGDMLQKVQPSLNSMEVIYVFNYLAAAMAALATS